MTNTAAVGGAGVNLALKLLTGETVATADGAAQPNTVLLEPVLADNTTDEGKAHARVVATVDGLDPLWPLGLADRGLDDLHPRAGRRLQGPGRVVDPATHLRGMPAPPASPASHRTGEGPMTVTTATDLLLEAVGHLEDVRRRRRAASRRRSRCDPARSTRSWAPTAPARARSSRSSPAPSGPTAGRSPSAARDARRPLAGRGPPRRPRVRLPGAGAHPGPGHPRQPAPHRDARSSRSATGSHELGLERPRPRRHGPRSVPLASLRDHRPRPRAGHRAGRADARRDDRGPAGEPDRAGARGHRPPARRRALRHLHLAPDDRDRRGLRPRDGPPRGRDRRRRRRDRRAPRRRSSS